MKEKKEGKKSRKILSEHISNMVASLWVYNELRGDIADPVLN